MLSNLKITHGYARSEGFSPQNRAEALTTNLELFTPTYLLHPLKNPLLNFLQHQLYELNIEN